MTARQSHRPENDFASSKTFKLFFDCFNPFVFSKLKSLQLFPFLGIGSVLIDQLQNVSLDFVSFILGDFVLLCLARMEKEGIAIDSEIKANYR